MGETEIGKLSPHLIPPDFTRELSRWARWAVFLETGCTITVAWSDAGDGPVAASVSVTPFPGQGAPRPARARRLGGRLCQVLTAAVIPLQRLAAHGVEPQDALDVLWRLERTPVRRPKPSRDRRAEAATLEHAARIVDAYRDDLAEHTPRVRVTTSDDPERRRVGRLLYPSGDALRWVAKTVRTRTGRKGGPPAQRVHAAVRVLQALATRAGSTPPDREIAEVVKATWPTLYRPKDFKKADPAQKLRRRARRRKS